ncbi:hypothetical protein [Pantoea sp. S62]|uniref:coiled-coil domain-containing protein n=1 Tax=Pantoea sp. S62 TaxID=2769342 RepID=UPI001913367C|nr:hypothetical protein [Pantoea sp. S62]MBK5013902.1 hypothetical protein [Pantoea sp. S62]
MSVWKDHPVIIAIGSGCTVLTFSFALIFNYFIPVMREADQNQIKSLNLKIEENNEEIKRSIIKATAKEDLIAQKNREISDLKRNINQRIDDNNDLKMWFFDYTVKNSFSFNSPYPTGYAKIRPYDTIEQFLKVYKSPQIEATPDRSYLSVKTDNTYIREITYYFDDNNERITHIAFYVRDGKEELNNGKVGAYASDLLDVLQNNLGVGKTCHNDTYRYWISADKKTVTYLKESLSYMVMNSVYTPTNWPNDCRKQIYLETKSVSP